MIDYLNEKKMHVGEEKTVLELKSQVKKYIRRKERYEVVRVAQENGHEVLFTPPYHSDIQPIELLWALIKGNIGRQYDDMTILDTVHSQLLSEFDNISKPGCQRIQKMINSCSKTSHLMFAAMDEDDMYDSDDADDESFASEDMSHGDSDDEIGSLDYVVEAEILTGADYDTITLATNLIDFKKKY